MVQFFFSGNFVPFNECVLGDIPSHSDLVLQDPSFHIKFPKPIEVVDGVSPQLTGHLKELGMQSPPIAQIPEYFDEPTPRKLWDTQVKVYRPAVYRGMLNGSPAVEKWGSDKYMTKEFGDQEVLVEKKFEDRKSEPKRMTIKAFLEQYKLHNWYVVTILPNAMRKDLKVPKPLKCGTFRENLQELNLWIGTHGTRSVLHYDADNIIHCVVSGRKDWILIHPDHKPKLDMVWGAKGQGSGFSHVSVDHVDLVSNPQLSDIPWEYVTLYGGDCLYLPPQYLHQVRSYNRSVSATYLFYPRDTFSDEDCKNVDLDRYMSLSDVYVYWVYEKGQETVDMGYQNPVNVKKNTVLTIQTMGLDTINKKEFMYIAYMAYGEEVYLMAAVIRNLFEAFDTDNDQTVSIEDIENLDIETWKDFCRATDNPHGPTKSERTINDEKSEKSPNFNPRENDYYRDGRMARKFLKFIVIKEGKKNLITFPQFKENVRTVYEPIESAFVLLDLNMDGVLNKNEIDRISNVSIRRFARMGYVYIKNPKLHGGGLWEDIDILEGDKDEINFLPFHEEIKFVEDCLHQGYNLLTTSPETPMDKVEFKKLFAKYSTSMYMKALDLDFLFRILGGSKEIATKDDFSSVLFKQETKEKVGTKSVDEVVVRKDRSDHNIYKRKLLVSVIDAMIGVYSVKQATEEKLDNLRNSRKEEL